MGDYLPLILFVLPIVLVFVIAWLLLRKGNVLPDSNRRGRVFTSGDDGPFVHLEDTKQDVPPDMRRAGKD